MQNDEGPQQADSAGRHAGAAPPPGPSAHAKVALGAEWLAANFGHPPAISLGGSPCRYAADAGVTTVIAAPLPPSGLDGRPVWQRLAPIDNWARPFLDDGTEAAGPADAGAGIAQSGDRAGAMPDRRAGQNDVARLHVTLAQKSRRARRAIFGALLAAAAAWLVWPEPEPPAQITAAAAAAPLAAPRPADTPPPGIRSAAAIPAPELEASAAPVAPGLANGLGAPPRAQLAEAAGRHTAIARTGPRQPARDRAAPEASPSAALAKPKPQPRPDAPAAKTPLQGLIHGINAAGTGAQSGLTNLVLGVRRLFQPRRGKAT